MMAFKTMVSAVSFTLLVAIGFGGGKEEFSLLG